MRLEKSSNIDKKKINKRKYNIQKKSITDSEKKKSIYMHKNQKFQSKNNQTSNSKMMTETMNSNNHFSQRY